MRRNSLILQKKFSTRWRHLYISKSPGIEVIRLALGGITAAAPRSSRSARIASLSKALSARRALKSRSVRSGRSEEHTSELQSRQYLVCRLLLEKKKISCL